MGWGFWLGTCGSRASFEDIVVQGMLTPVLRVTHHDRERIFVLQEIDENGQALPLMKADLTTPDKTIAERS